MVKTAKRELGDKGEEVAAKYLTGRGYAVLERNYLRPWGEIDIVAQKAKRLYFVEVKSVSRESSRWPNVTTPPSGAHDAGREPDSYRPEENVHPAKLKRLHRAIQTYLLDHKVRDDIDWQIDVACVYLDFSTHKAHVEMLENVIM